MSEYRVLRAEHAHYAYQLKSLAQNPLITHYSLLIIALPVDN
jgi:hypothetical protein